MPVRDRERRTEAGARCHAEQVRIRQWIVEDALVRRARDREHAPDEGRERDPGRPDLPQHRLVEARERRVHMQQRHVRERRLDDPDGADADRPNAEADEDGTDEERRREEAPRARDSSRPDACLGSPDRRHYFLRAAAAIARAKSTTRGPQREATLSFTAITRWFFTAAIPLQPGRAATVAAV